MTPRFVLLVEDGAEVWGGSRGARHRTPGRST
jgi:hypothetical protein